MQYLLDTNTLIEAKNDYYRFSFCPGYWDWIHQTNDKDILFIIDKIKSELLRGNDQLTEWTKTSPAKLFIKPSEKLTLSLAAVAKWVNDRSYSVAAKTVFFDSADYYLIAYAHSLNYSVVTREKRAPGSINRVKIPDVCDGMQVNVINPFELLEVEGAQLICT